ncbi:MAG: exodeoxyribonuclease V subunit gamma [Clostridia bacterium]|nr:exodeoxyribonuclease V subunit gamma [Clostridia bacterium]
MVHFIIGRSGSGKTHFIRNELLKDASEKVLIVPEQYSFESERALVEMNKGKGMITSTEVYSFSRLCDRVFSLQGGIAQKEFDITLQTLIMGKTLQNLCDELTIFKKSSKSPDFIKAVITSYNEMKNGGISVEDITRTADTVNDLHLSHKLKDISTIFTHYEALAGVNFTDKNDELNILLEKLKDFPFFKGKSVYFDGFKSFTGMQMKIIELIMTQANEVYFSLCTDTLTRSTPSDVFYTVKITAEDIFKLASKNNIPVNAPKVMEDSMFGRSESLKAVEEILCGKMDDNFDGESDNITIVNAPNKFDECNFVARTISKLIRDDGYRFRDISVITGAADQYFSPMKAAFEVADIPFFADERRPLDCQPIMVALKRLMESISNPFSTETILSLLKIGITNIPLDDVYLLENYCYLWNIKGSQFTSPFTYNPKGADNNLDDKANAQLEKLNDIRSKVITPLVDLKEKAKETNSAEEFSRAIFEYFVSVGVDKNLSDLATEIENEGDVNTAEDIRRSFALFVDVLEKGARGLSSEPISFKQYATLINVVIDSLDMGSLPQGLDEVSLCSAKRSRPANPKIVFVLGANDGVFPSIPTEGGIFSTADRKKLIEQNLPLPDLNERALSEENFLFYSAVCCASERIYITYSQGDSTGLPLVPSAMITELENKITNANKVKYKDFCTKGDIPYGVETVSGALQTLATEARKGSEVSDALFKYFDTHQNGGADTLKNILNPAPLNIPNDVAVRMYGKDLTVSPTALDSYHKCSFNYFCKYGLKAYPKEQVSIDAAARGTIVHAVLENLVNKYMDKTFTNYSPDILKEEARNLTDAYVEEHLGGYADKTQTFIYEINSIKKSLEFIVEYMAKELSGSKFRAVKCELKMDKYGDINPEEIPLTQGGTISVKGVVDRLDAYEEDGVTYLRVVDYKTGNKDLHIGDIYCGIGLQMFVYLFTLVKSKKFGEDSRPAAVLYFPARAKALGKSDAPAQKMKGVVLNDQAVMDASNTAFMPYTINKNGSIGARSWLGSEDFFEGTENKIRDILRNMGDKLHKGEISANPLDPKGGDACQYCDYVTVCPHGNTALHGKTPVETEEMKKDILERGDYDGTFSNSGTTESD